MYILDDESIQSVIYRAHLLKGISDFRNVIDAKGRWITFPRIKADTLDIYRQLGEKKILSILQRQALVPFTEHRFGNPAPYISGLNYFFSISKKNLKPSKSTIQFCIKCIYDDIYNYGFCCFKIYWLNASHCKKHETPLLFIPEKSRNDTLHYLKIIFRGDVPDGCHEVSRDRHDFYYEPPKSRKKKQLYIPKCLKLKYLIFLSEEIFPPKLDCSDPLRTTIQRAHPPILYIKKIHSANNVFNALKDNKSTQLKDFLYENSEIKVFHTGVLNKNSIPEAFLKSNTDDCSKCDHMYCLSNEKRYHFL